MMKTNRDFLRDGFYNTIMHNGFEFINVQDAIKLMDLTNINTLNHLVSLFQINSKKINGDTAIRIVNEVIEEIKKS